MKNDKLLKDESTINIYKKTSSIYLEDALQEINIDHIPLDVLKSIVIPNVGDPFLYDGYPLTENELNKVNDFLQEKIIPDFELYDYALECYGVRG